MKNKIQEITSCRICSSKDLEFVFIMIIKIRQMK